MEDFKLTGSMILEALHKVMEEITNVEKDGWNEYHKYNFVSEAGLVAAVRPALLKHGLFILGPHVREGQHPVPDSQGVTTFVVEYQLAHISGVIWPEKFAVLAQGCDRDSKGGWGDKGAYKGHTGAHKYLLLRLLNLVTGQEPEDDSPGQKTQRDAGQASEGSRRTRAPAEPVTTGRLINGDVARDAGIYRDAFNAAEKIYGKELVTKDQSKRFAPVDYAVGKMGCRKLGDILATPENLRKVKTFIAEFGQGAGEPSADEQGYQGPA